MTLSQIKSEIKEVQRNPAYNFCYLEIAENKLRLINKATGSDQAFPSGVYEIPLTRVIKVQIDRLI